MPYILYIWTQEQLGVEDSCQRKALILCVDELCGRQVTEVGAGSLLSAVPLAVVGGGGVTVII